MDKNTMYGENHEKNDPMNKNGEHNSTSGSPMMGSNEDKKNPMDKPMGGMGDKANGAEATCKDKMGEHTSSCESGKKEAKGENCSTEKSGHNGGCCGQKS